MQGSGWGVRGGRRGDEPRETGNKKVSRKTSAEQTSRQKTLLRPSARRLSVATNITALRYYTVVHGRGQSFKHRSALRSPFLSDFLELSPPFFLSLSNSPSLFFPALPNPVRPLRPLATSFSPSSTRARPRVPSQPPARPPPQNFSHNRELPTGARARRAHSIIDRMRPNNSAPNLGFDSDCSVVAAPTSRNSG